MDMIEDPPPEFTISNYLKLKEENIKLQRAKKSLIAQKQRLRKEKQKLKDVLFGDGEHKLIKKKDLAEILKSRDEMKRKNNDILENMKVLHDENVKLREDNESRIL